MELPEGIAGRLIARESLEGSDLKVNDQRLYGQVQDEIGMPDVTLDAEAFMMSDGTLHIAC